MAKYRLSPAAEHDLESIWLCTCQQWSLQQANQYIDMLTATFDKLAGLPMIASACDHIRSGYRHSSAGRHRIISVSHLSALLSFESCTIA